MVKNVDSDDSFLEKLKNAYKLVDKTLREDFTRSLSFQDSVFDRFERSQSLGFGDGTSIYNSALVFGNVFVGTNTWIGPNVILDGSGGSLTIGNFCSISSGVHIYTHDTVLWSLSSGEIDKKRTSLSIGDNVYIGSQTVIACGSQIGTRCVIAANSFVNCDVPNDTIFAGSPAKRVGFVKGTGKQIELIYDNK